MFTYTCAKEIYKKTKSAIYKTILEDFETFC